MCTRCKRLTNGISFTFHFAEELPCYIESDRAKISQIINNLASNAIKFTPKGGTIKMFFLRKGDELILQVEDTGIGISSEHMKNIFNRFEQADDSITRHYGGTGLGLAITYELVKILGGDITCDSVIDEGSSFVVRVPLVECVQEEFTSLAKSMEEVEFQSSSKILIVEDNPVNQELLVELLASLGLTNVLVANNGSEGVEKAKTFDPNLIFMDLHMPVMDGLAATQILRDGHQHYHVPIVAFSADAFSDRRKEAEALGISDYLVKPLDIEEVMAVLMKYLSFHQKDKAGGNRESEEVNIDRILEDLKELESIPIFKGDQLLRQISKIRKGLGEDQKSLGVSLKEMEDAVFNGDSERFYQEPKRSLNPCNEAGRMKRILIVDDSPEIIKFLREVLKSRGYATGFISKSEYLLQVLEEEEFDLILMDYKIDERNAVDLLRTIKADGRFTSIPVIVLTGIDDDEVLERCFQTGAVDYLSKPVKLLELMCRIESVLALQFEKYRYAELLSHVFPKAVSDKLLHTGTFPPTRCDEVIVGFADFVGFTALAESWSPEFLVSTLESYFMGFDFLLAEYGFEPLKTIGDGYMFAGGLDGMLDDPYKKATLLGQELCQFVEEKQTKETPMVVRVGLHVGPVVAGVIGQRKFSYDIWGDTVNTAQRVESYGTPGKVTLSHALYEKVADFVTCDSQEHDVKGKGKMNIHTVETVDLKPTLKVDLKSEIADFKKRSEVLAARKDEREN